MQGKERILLVDDDAAFLFSAAVVLRSEGYRVSVADGGEKAIALVLEAAGSGDPFALLITDVHMCGMSGLALIDALRRIDIPLTILVMTGIDGVNFHGELCSRGCSDPIEKPFEPKYFTERVREILVGAGFGRERE